MGTLENPDPSWTPLPALLTEELKIQPLRRHAGGGDRHEFVLCARAGGVQQASRRLLTRSRGTDDHHSAVGGGDLGDRRAQGLDRRRASDEAVRHDRLSPKPAVLALEVRRFQRALQQQQEPVGLERLLKEVIGAPLDGAHGGFDVAVAADHDHRQVFVEAFEHVEQLQPVHAAAGHPDVEDDAGRLARADAGKRGVRIARRSDRIAFVLAECRRQLADVGLVVDNEDIADHAWASKGGAEEATPSPQGEMRGSPGLPGRSGGRRASRAPPCSSRIRLTMARPRPVPFSRVVT